jgi:ACR3 family arsenite efflux pump ArsB
MHRIISWWDDHQVLLYMAAILIGAAVGLAAPQLAPALGRSIEPVLILLLFATFLAVPLIEVGKAFRDVRFLGTVLVANFIIVPVVVFGLSRFVADDRGLLVGVLLVLLTPCIDYVIVFTGIAGGASARLLAATPLLMLLQILLLPVYLFLFADGDVLTVIDVGPFIEAFLLLIVLPLVSAAVGQGIARRHRTGQTVEKIMAAAMVPLMMVTLAVVIGSQIAAVGSQVLSLTRVIPLYVAFVVIAVIIGRVAGRAAGVDVPGTRAAMFSVTTRNSLVVLPLALALPPALSIAPLAVVTQTLVELVAMVVLVHVVPIIVPEHEPHHLTSASS